VQKYISRRRIILILIEYYYCDKIKDNESSRACSTNMEDGKYYVLVGKHDGRGSLVKLGVDGRIC
jgi:hypothetical protein